MKAKCSSETSVDSACHLLSQAGFLLGLFFDPEDGGDVPKKRRLTFNGLHSVIAQKIELFITEKLFSKSDIINEMVPIRVDAGSPYFRHNFLLFLLSNSKIINKRCLLVHKVDRIYFGHHNFCTDILYVTYSLHVSAFRPS
jgi:hypothetical protein